jgi:hypothetical protein
LIFDIACGIFLKQFNNTWFNNYNTAQIVMLQTYLKNRNIPYQFGFVLEKELKQIKQTTLVDMNRVTNLSWIDFCNKHCFKRPTAHYGCDAHKTYIQHITLLRN